MFCNQCEQTAKGTGCTITGVCGKKPEVAALQDLLLHAVKGMSIYATEGRKVGIIDPEVNTFTCKALFSTLTNVNFNPTRFQKLIGHCVELTDRLKEKVAKAGGRINFDEPAAGFKPAADMAGLIKQGEDVGMVNDHDAPLNIQSLQQILVFGMKGISAYADHACILGREDDQIYAFIHEGLAALTNKELNLNDWIALVFKCGKINLRTMELLDLANTGTYGHPVPTEVPLGHKQGKCILVSGHDLKDIEELLKQTEGKGIYIYTHGEMLPAHGYPELKKYKHLFGHYGTAWQNQRREFAEFPGAVLITTNCIQDPKAYTENIFTTGMVGWPGVAHVQNGEFGPVIERAFALPGYTSDEDNGSIMVGFARNAVLSVADKVVELVKSGTIKHFFLVGGCDGAKQARSYYTQFVENTPKDTLILTLGCGKYRFFDKKLGDIGGIPRLLDMGQCNDAYSAIQVAFALAKAFDCGVNDLPLSLVLSWFEQKAVAILLTLFHLGIKNILLGPSLPAFISPDILKVLVENFAVKLISTPEQDLASLLH
ncbi:MAG TPA: hydroxylamine reductase [Desulfotomaculum sp.]|nr:hydroxylamine reductase [Desulfotomaculum sp.]